MMIIISVASLPVFFVTFLKLVHYSYQKRSLKEILPLLAAQFIVLLISIFTLPAFWLDYKLKYTPMT